MHQVAKRVEVVKRRRCTNAIAQNARNTPGPPRTFWSSASPYPALLATISSVLKKISVAVGENCAYKSLHLHTIWELRQFFAIRAPYTTSLHF